ncbi:MAG: hypothetical protein ACOX1Y_01965 [Zhaonellaceae bacterium]
MKLSWTYYFFVALPESTAYTLLAFALLKLPLRWLSIAKIGVIYGTLAYFIRHLPISFGIHTVILIAIFAALMSHFTDCKIASVFLVGLVNMVILGISEILSGTFLMNLLGVTYETVQTNDWLLVIFVIPQVILLITLAFIIRKYHIPRGKGNEVS